MRKEGEAMEKTKKRVLKTRSNLLSPSSPPALFEIPSLPPTMNKIYLFLAGQGRVVMRPEVMRWKTEAKLFIPRIIVPSKKLSILMWFHSNWFYKNGNMKRADCPNLEKVLIDAVAERLGFDDSLFWHKESYKVQDQNEKAVVYLDLFKE